MITNYYVDSMDVYYKEPNKHLVQAKRVLTSIVRKVQGYEKVAHKYLNERAYNKWIRRHGVIIRIY